MSLLELRASESQQSVGQNFSITAIFFLVMFRCLSFKLGPIIPISQIKARKFAIEDFFVAYGYSAGQKHGKSGFPSYLTPYASQQRRLSDSA